MNNNKFDAWEDIDGDFFSIEMKEAFGWVYVGVQDPSDEDYYYYAVFEDSEKLRKIAEFINKAADWLDDIQRADFNESLLKDENNHG